VIGSLVRERRATKSAKRVLSGYAGRRVFALWRQDPLNARRGESFISMTRRWQIAAVQVAGDRERRIGVLRQTDRVLAGRHWTSACLARTGFYCNLRTLASSPADQLWPSGTHSVLADPPAGLSLDSEIKPKHVCRCPPDAEQVSRYAMTRWPTAMEAELSDQRFRERRSRDINPPRVAKTECRLTIPMARRCSLR